MTEPRRLQGFPPRSEADKPRASSIDAGRIRLCGDLLVSANRSWRVESPTPDPPVAAFKAMAPVAFWSDGGPEAGDIYLTAIGPHDAWWLGFETVDQPYAMLLEIDGRNALTGRKDKAASLSANPPNFLLVPDQPWFDALRDIHGQFHQLIPSFGLADEPSAGATVRLTVFPLSDDALSPVPDQDGDEVQPLYSGNDLEAGANTHRWPGRTLIEADTVPQSCGRITLAVVTPEVFQSLTGKTLDPEAFKDNGAAPAPFDPFQ